MKCMRNVVVLCVVLVTTQVMSMRWGDDVLIPADVMTEIIYYLDVPSVAVFPRVCNNSWKAHPIDDFLYRYPQVCKALNPTQHLNFFVHYAQQNDARMIKHLMHNESDENKKKRNNAMWIFGYEVTEQQNVTCNIRGYKGILRTL